MKHTKLVISAFMVVAVGVAFHVSAETFEDITVDVDGKTYSYIMTDSDEDITAWLYDYAYRMPAFEEMRPNPELSPNVIAKMEELGVCWSATDDAFVLNYYTPEKGAYIIFCDDLDTDTELIYAVRERKANKIKQLLASGADVNAKNIQGVTALMWASYFNNTKAMQLFMDAGADVNTKDNEGYTALIIAAEKNNVNAIKLLIKAGADVNAKCNDGATAIMRAAAHNSAKAIPLLIVAGADVSAKDNEGCTALMYAAANDSKKSVELLVKAGADVNAQNDDGDTALDIARKEGSKGTEKVLSEYAEKI